MKKYNLLLLSVCLLLFSGYLQAQTDWSKPDKDKEYFKFQEDVSPFSEYISTIATINFGGKLFNFSNYRGWGWVNGKIILKKFTNVGGGTEPEIKWKCETNDNINNLKDLGGFNWQPAPVIFDNQLYLFFGNTNKGISYSTYNDGEDSWSTPTEIDVNFTQQLGCGMTAVVIGEHLCLVYQNAWSNISILTTKDLATWQKYPTGRGSKIVPITGYGDPLYSQVSAITKSYWDNGVKKLKLQYAYINQSLNPVIVEGYFDENENFQITEPKLITNESKYQSVTLVEGTVKNDTSSSGKCVQAFLKLNIQDNNYWRYRIQRFQSKNDGPWIIQENNLVQQNYGWASEDVNLSAVNFYIPDKDNFKQYMCLIYRGYDDWDHPLNCLWAETDRLVLNPDGAISQTLSDPENTMYIGYIEGPPPFYANNKSGLGNPYLKGGSGAVPISELEYTSETGTSISDEIGFKIGFEAKFTIHLFKVELEYMFGYKEGNETSIMAHRTFKAEAMEEGFGYYICCSPNIESAQYYVKDVTGSTIDTINYQYISDIAIDYKRVELEHSLHLNPGDPSTYYKRDNINFASYSSKRIAKNNNSWTSGTATSAGVKIDSSHSVTYSHEAKLKLGFGQEKVWEVSAKGEFEYKITTTTTMGNEFTAYTNMNEPKEPGDYEQLNYDIQWLLPVEGQSNWWLHEGAADQKTWCITYDVKGYKLVDGTIVGNASSFWQDGDNNPALSISTFTAGKTNAGVTLKWQTSTELNNYGFEIQRLAVNQELSANSFETIGFVEGNGNSDSPTEYSFTDTNPLLGKINYRIKQMDNDNNATYSDIEVVEIKAEQLLPTEFALFQNFPNPFNPTTNISFTVPSNAHATLKIFNMLGQEIATLFNGETKVGINNKVQFNASGLSSGIYFSRLESAGQVQLKKMQLVK